MNTRCDRAGLQIVIGFGLQSATRILKNGLQSAMESQTMTDYKVIQYKYDIAVFHLWHHD